MNTVISNWISVSANTIKILRPSLALKIAKTTLFKPKRKPSYWPKPVTQCDTKTRYGAVKTYKYGQGKCIWLIHGCSGCAFDSWPLMQNLSEAFTHSSVTTLVRTNKLGHNKILHSKKLLHGIEPYDGSHLDKIVHWHEVG